jgi:hypothetical protein
MNVTVDFSILTGFPVTTEADSIKYWYFQFLKTENRKLERDQLKNQRPI